MVFQQKLSVVKHRRMHGNFYTWERVQLPDSLVDLAASQSGDEAPTRGRGGGLISGYLADEVGVDVWKRGRRREPSRIFLEVLAVLCDFVRVFSLEGGHDWRKASGCLQQTARPSRPGMRCSRKDPLWWAPTRNVFGNIKCINYLFIFSLFYFHI